MGINPGNIAFSLPPAEDDMVRKQKDLERQMRENAAARTAEATQIGRGGIRVTDGGSITVEAPGSIDLQGGAFSATTLAASTTITAGAGVTAGGTVQGAAVVSTGDIAASGTVTATGSVSGANVTASGRVTSAAAFRSAGSRAYVMTVGYAGAWLDGDGTLGISPSSIRFKTDVEQWQPDIERLLMLRAVMFRYDLPGADPDAPKQIGFIAEELDALGFPEFLFYDPDGVVEGINYDRLTVALLVLAQTQETRLQNLEARLDTAGF